MTAESFAVVIVSYRTPGLTIAAARSALDAAADAVVVVDNQSGDDTARRLRSIGDPRVVVVDNRVNVGFGAGANVGARRVSTDVLLFLNSDAELTKEAADHLLAELTRFDGRAVIGPRLIGPNGVVEHSAGLLPVPSDIAVRALGLHVIGWWLVKLPLAGSLVRRTRFLREYASVEVAHEAFDTNFEPAPVSRSGGRRSGSSAASMSSISCTSRTRHLAGAPRRAGWRFGTCHRRL